MNIILLSLFALEYLKIRKISNEIKEPFLEEDAAVYLAEKKIVLFGLDNITIGYFRDEESIIKTHRALLEAGIYILEDCALGGVPAGDYDLLCLPMLLYKDDAAPCRAILRPLK